MRLTFIIVWIFSVFLLTINALSPRAEALLFTITLEIKHLNSSLEDAFIPIADFYEEIKEVIGKTLESDNEEVKANMDKNQYKYFALVYRFEKAAEESVARVSLKYIGLTDTSAILIDEIDDNASRLVEVLERRGCNIEQIDEFLDNYFNRMLIAFHFEMNHLYRMSPIGTSVGNESFFVHKNIVTGLYDCLDNIDLLCYLNNEEMFDTYSSFVSGGYNNYAAYQINKIGFIETFLQTRIRSMIEKSKDTVWTNICTPPTTTPDPTTISSSSSTATDPTTEEPNTDSGVKRYSLHLFDTLNN